MTPTLFRHARFFRHVLLALLLAGPPAVSAQDGGPGTGGIARLEQDRRYLNEWRRVLVIGAHPDDEDTDLITILSRGHGIPTAYLSLSRGEGGQNLIGGELGASLGVLRSEELLAARAHDGGHQFFTRAYDFGFSKNAEETFTFWPRDTLVKDIVRVIRRFRPQVIVSVWSGTPRDGHGHHQASGIVARDAFRAAGDPARFRDLVTDEGLVPWSPAKFYVSTRFSGATGGLVLEGGALDPAIGHSLHQIAMRSRSQHRSQDMGRLEEPGPARTGVLLVERADGATGPDDSLFAGIAPQPARPTATRDEVLLAERGVIVDAYATDREVVPGQLVPVTALVWNAGSDTIHAAMSALARAGWELDEPDACGREVAIAPGAVHRCTLPLRVEAAAQPDQPYFLREAVAGGLYTWSGPTGHWGEAFDPPLRAVFRIRMGGATRPAGVVREVTARSLDQAVGEVRAPITIVPRLLVDVAPGRMLWRRDLGSRPITVTVEHAGPDSTMGTIRLRLPDGWRGGDPQPVAFGLPGERATFTFTVVPPAGVGEGEVSFLAEAVTGTDTMRIGARRVGYAHVRERVLFHLAEATAVVADVRFATGRRIGYVRGAADAIPEALAAAGVTVRVLDMARTTATTLDSLDVVVIGPRAYESDRALGRAHPLLLAWAERGGTLITQYQQYQYVDGGFPPHPLSIGRPHDRVTDERAPVTVLDPAHALVRTPNVIRPADFDGWVQERGLYFARTWDAAWTPVLAMHDPGETPMEGGLLVARLGRGTVVYTGLAFFRQLPAAVPGAWKIFANLLALGPAR